MWAPFLRQVICRSTALGTQQRFLLLQNHNLYSLYRK